MRRGQRQPKPTALKILQGNPGKRALNKLEPKYVPGAPPKPDGLDEIESEHWDKLVAIMAPVGALTEADGDLLELACSAYANWKRAKEFVKKQGQLTYKTGKKGQAKIRRTWPELQQMNLAYRQYLSTLVEMGLTPSSRSRVKATAPLKPSGIEAYFQSAKV